MKVTGIEIDTRAKTVEVMGDPYAYLGGMIDLHPERRSMICVGHNVDLKVHLGEVEGYDGFSQYNWIAFSSGLSGARDAMVHLSVETYDANANILEASVEHSRMAEREEQVPVGFTDALIDWLREQGVEI